MKPILNIADVDVRVPQTGHGPQGASADKYDLRRGAIGTRIGARDLGYRLTVVAPGKTACPFHSHRSEEEMFFILEGKGELRYGVERYPLRTGDVIACPVGGPETAHQILNTGDADMRYLAVSTMARVDICEYPDSGKIGFYQEQVGPDAGSPPPVHHLSRPADGRDYWEGE